MKVRIGNGLLPINLLVIILIVIIIFVPSNIVRIILGLPFVLFFPGYALIAVLFPKRSDITGVERIALSFGTSIAAAALIGLVLNYTPWGINTYSILVSLAIFILATSIAAWYRQRSLTEEERFAPSFSFDLLAWRGQSTLDKTISIILIVAILGAIGTFGYTAAIPKVGERFTEFYILELEGKATDYPKELMLGEEGRVIVGIVNREYGTVSYRVEVTINGIRDKEIGPVVLGHEEKWEGEVSFTPTKVGDNQKVEFLLYKESKPVFKEPIHLWVNVKGKSQS